MPEQERDFSTEFTEMMIGMAAETPEMHMLRRKVREGQISDETLTTQISDIGRYYGLDSFEDSQRAFRKFGKPEENGPHE